MDQKLATVEIIHSFEKHTNADSLEIAKVMGFQVVVKKDQFKPDETVVFVWPDTICEVSDWNKFLDKDNTGKPIKIKSCKLRSEFSTGLVLPISVLDLYEGEKNIGDDVSEFLKIQKYIKDDGNDGSNGDSAGSFPSIYISKTDETLAQSIVRTHEEFIGEEVYLSTKIDGQSLTFIRHNDEVMVCSRNLKITEGENRFWNTVRTNKLIESTVGMNISVQGEQYGGNIQKNPLGVQGIHFAIFNIKNLDTGEYYGLAETQDFCKRFSIPMVPVIKQFMYDASTTFDSIQDIADTLKYVTNNKPAEGVVMRPIIPKYSKFLRKMLSVKFINRNYKD